LLVEVAVVLVLLVAVVVVLEDIEWELGSQLQQEHL
jgi:hypothetical protein